MRKFFIFLALFLTSSFSLALTIDFEEVPLGFVNENGTNIGLGRGDLRTQGFVVDYVDQGAGLPLISDGAEGLGRSYMNCPNCQPVERIDIFQINNQSFSLTSLDVTILGAGQPGLVGFNFSVIGTLESGGILSQSINNVDSLQTMNFDSGWQNLNSIRLEIDTTPLPAGASFESISVIDNIVVTPVPVPAAVWMFLSALAGLGIARVKG